MENLRLVLASPTWVRHGASGARLWRPVAERPGADDGAPVSSPAHRTGCWTVVEETPRSLRITTDRARSHHLLFARADGSWLVSDDPSRMRALLPAWERDAAAAQAFLHLGFVPGTRTLAAGVRATPAASTVTLHTDGSWECDLWETYRYAPEPIRTAADFDLAFTAALDSAVSRMLETTAGRQLLIPLSGGLDSRLLAVWLHRLGAENVTTFTYGRPESRETQISRQVARALELPWFSIDLDPRTMARAWFDGESEDFQAGTWGAVSLPHVQDWWALREIRRRGLIADDAVLLPGHTVVGNMHDEDLLRHAVTREQVLTAIARHHAALQGGLNAFASLPILGREVLRAAQETGLGDGDRARGVQETIEWFNVRERQAKYINNSMKSYEFFGYGWALPMMDVEVRRCWLRGSERLTATRAWYRDFTAKVFTEAAGRAPELYAPASTTIPAAPKRILLAAMRATRTDRLLSRYRSMRTMLHHPMAFEAFSSPIPRAEELLRLAMGASSLGLWTRLFLDNRWGASLVPE